MIRPKNRPKNGLTEKTTKKRSVTPDDQKIDSTGFLTFEQVFPRKG